MRLQYCQLLRSTHFTHKLWCAKSQDCFPVLAFDLIKGTLRYGDNFWSDFLRLIVVVVKAFQHQETLLSPHRNMQQEQRLLTICWTAWIVLPWVLYYPWSCSLFRASGHGSLVTRSQVINTTGLHNDYTFHSGLQAQEIQLGSPDHFPHERCGLGTRLDCIFICDC